MFRYLLLPLCALLLFGCDQKSEQPASTAKAETVQLNPLPEVTQQPLTLLKDPLDAVLVETAAEAIPTWRKYAAVKPTLLLLSQYPELTPIPTALQKVARDLVLTGTTSELGNRATAFTPSPLLLPDMALSAALNAGFFSKVIWILPVNDRDELILDTFRRQLVGSGTATVEESQSFLADPTGFTGMIRGCEIQAIYYKSLGKLEMPSVVHIDLSFFKAMYISEIKTPIHPMAYQLLGKLRAAGARSYTTTISYSHREHEVSVQVRFLGRLLKNFFAHPDMLNKPADKKYSQHQQALYISNFFQKEKVLEIYRNLVREYPQNPDYRFALYLISKQFKDGDRTLHYLDEAVKLDRMYALEYLALAPLALQKKRPDEALRMLSLAEEVFSTDPFIKYRKAEFLSLEHRGKEARKLLIQLEGLDWSIIYYPQMPKTLKDLAESLQDQP